MNEWRLLPLEAGCGSFHMAVDEALVRLHAEGRSPPTLRFYVWAPPAVSLGRLQRSAGLDLGACRRLGLDVVRRSTGGRAVLHWGDLTYSLVAGVREGIPLGVAAAYRRVCEGLAEGFRALGVAVAPGEEPASSAGPDVCFLRSVAGDLSVEGRKLVGSAQTWRRESLLQHGSILLRSQAPVWAELSEGRDGSALSDRLAARTTSLGEILGRPVGAEEAARALAGGFSAALGLQLRPGALTRASHSQMHKVDFWGGSISQHIEFIGCGSLKVGL